MVRDRYGVRVISHIIIGLMVLMLSGCAGISDVVDNWNSDLPHRIKLNTDEVLRIRDAGLMDKHTADMMIEAIEKQEKRIEEMSPENLKKHVVQAWGLASNAVGSGSGDDAVALDIITTDKMGMFNDWLDKLSYEVHVLKRDPLNTGKDENSLATMDMISKEIQNAKDGKASKIDNYFVNTGKKLWDVDDPNNHLLKDTVSSGEFSSTESNVNRLGYHFIGVKHDPETDEIISRIEIKLNEFNRDAVDRLIGADGVNKDKYVIVGTKCYLMEYPVNYVSGFITTDNNTFKAEYKESDMTVNLLTKEMRNKSGYVCQADKGDNILSVLGGDDTKYAELGKSSFIVDGLAGGEPSIGYLPSGKQLQNADNYGRVVLRDYLELNYMPGVVDNENFVAMGRRLRLTKFKGTGDMEIGLFIDRGGNKVDNSMNIKITDLMDISTGISEGRRNKLDIKTTTEGNLGIGSDGDTEGNGDTDSDDGAVSSGDNTSGDEDVLTSVGGVGESQSNLLETNYVNKIETSTIFPGSIVATQDTVESNNLGGTDSLDEGNDEDVGSSNTDNSDTDSDTGNSDTDNSDTDSNLDGDVNTGSGVDGSNSDKTDDALNNDERAIKQFFYGMAVDIDPFRSNLFSGWINITDDTPKGSLDWWNAWLGGTGYKYQVNRDRVIRFLTGNYAYELGENGYVVLDLNTIKRIQDDYNREDKVGLVTWFNTLFIILGFMVLGYSILVITAWVYDVNMIAGPRMLGLLTFGKWKAISSTDELPNYTDSKKHYMTFRKTLRSVFILCIIGMLLIFIDVIEIINGLVLLFGSLGAGLMEVIRGI